MGTKKNLVRFRLSRFKIQSQTLVNQGRFRSDFASFIDEVARFGLKKRRNKLELDYKHFKVGSRFLDIVKRKEFLYFIELQYMSIHIFIHEGRG